MKISIFSVSVLLANYGVNAFVLHNNAAVGSSFKSSSSSAAARIVPSQQKRILNMSSTDEQVAALREAARKAREEANRLAKELGKDVPESSTSPTKTVASPTTPVKSTLSVSEVSSLLSTINFESDDASSQVQKLDTLINENKLTLWKAATTSSANTNSPSPLRPYPVTLQFLEQRTGGKITGKSLGVDGEDDVTLENFKDATIGVVLGSTLLGIASLALLPENIGATLCYLIALVPILWLGIGSTAPGIIAGGIATFRGSADDKNAALERICCHEAGHFLCGYLCGLPIKSYQLNDSGIPCVEFHPSSEGEAKGRELNMDEIAALSVVAMSGSVAEVLNFEQAKGGGNDLLQLDALFRRSKEFIGAAKQQDLTRWGALASYNLINANKEKYDKLVSAFREKKSVKECIAIIEGN